MIMIADRKQAHTIAQDWADRNEAPVWIKYDPRTKWYEIDDNPDYMPNNATIILPEDPVCSA
jgi:hypothetical protein